MSHCRLGVILLTFAGLWTFPLSQAKAVQIAFGRTDLPQAWLASAGLPDAHKELQAVIAAGNSEKAAAAAIADFEKVILAGNPFDPKRHVLAIALNLMQVKECGGLSEFGVCVPDYKDREGQVAFCEDCAGRRETFKSGCRSSWLDLQPFPSFKSLGMLTCTIKDLSGEIFDLEKVAGKPGTARVKVSLTILVTAKGVRKEFRYTSLSCAVTAWVDAKWRDLKKGPSREGVHRSVLNRPAVARGRQDE